MNLLDPNELRSPEAYTILWDIHRVMASNHSASDQHHKPGIACSGKGVEMPGWKHWVYYWLVEKLIAHGRVPRPQINAPLHFHNLPYKVLIIGDGASPLGPYLATKVMTTWAVDATPVQESGIARGTSEFLRAQPVGGVLPFGDKLFDTVIVIEAGIGEHTQRETSRILADNGLALLIYPDSNRLWSPPLEDLQRHIPDLTGYWRGVVIKEPR